MHQHNSTLEVISKEKGKKQLKLTKAGPSTQHTEVGGVVHATLWGPGASVRAWGPGACVHGDPLHAWDLVRAWDPVSAWDLVRAWGSSRHEHV